jgi:hypothetical protein
MNAPAWAVTITVTLFAIAYSVSLVSCLHWFSTKFLPLSFRINISAVKTIAIYISVLLLFLMLSVIVFRRTEATLAAQSIDWIRYYDYASIGMWFTWFIVFKPIVPAFIVATISPDIQGFASRKHVFAAYGLHLGVTALLIKSFNWLIIAH